ncbi:MAG: hypothetical protein M1819_005024 [Sarea resinae]|nr:MAG: hypothetical protein M1819_005024 [Sarea resinae]
MYRIAADVFNDCAMILDCLSPALPKPARVFLLSIASILRALCGVAAGSSKASLSAHFARWGNLGELNAKDSSQETIISLMGMLVGSLVVSHLTSPLATWTALIILLTIHLAMNHAAVRAVSMHTLNRQRANIVFSTLIANKTILTPKEVSLQEWVFERDGVLRWMRSPVLAHCIVGASLETVLKSIAKSHETTSSLRDPSIELTHLLKIFQDEEYLLWYDIAGSKINIVLKEGAKTVSQLQSWAHALLIAHLHDQSPLVLEKRPSISEAEAMLQLLSTTLKQITSTFEYSMPQLLAAGWDLETAALEVRPGKRIALASEIRA